jgi:hypothetical protein
MLCPVCQLELGVERRADELVLTYIWKEWAARCRSRARGDPVSCAMLRPIILNLLPEAKAAPFRSEPRAKGWSAELQRKG